MHRCLPSIAVVGLLAACDNSVVVQLQTGPQSFQVSSAELMLPDALRDTSGGSARIASLSCPSGLCPTSTAVPIACEAGVCNPAPRTVSVPLGDVVDFDVLTAGARDVIRYVDAIEILDATYDISMNTLTLDLPAIEVYWGPASAVDVDPAMGVRQLGVVPAIAAGSAVGGSVLLDPDGVITMSDYLVTTSPRQVRFFARTAVDLEPGGPFPEGSLQATVNLRVRVSGSVVR